MSLNELFNPPISTSSYVEFKKFYGRKLIIPIIYVLNGKTIIFEYLNFDQILVEKIEFVTRINEIKSYLTTQGLVLLE